MSSNVTCLIYVLVIYIIIINHLNALWKNDVLVDSKQTIFLENLCQGLSRSHGSEPLVDLTKTVIVVKATTTEHTKNTRSSLFRSTRTCTYVLSSAVCIQNVCRAWISPTLAHIANQVSSDMILVHTYKTKLSHNASPTV